MGLREDILKPSEAKPMPFPVEVSGTVQMLYLRRFTAAQAAEWHKYAQTQADETGNITYPDTYRAKLVQLSVVDEHDELLFKDSDVSALTTKPALFIAQIFLASCKLNGLTNAEVAEARANFLQTLRNAIGSASRGTSENPTSPPSGSDSPPTE